tara:strand:- start:15 stop:1301 length:1287 start_codon:yes stop_codon:yes gene_type:complete
MNKTKLILEQSTCICSTSLNKYANIGHKKGATKITGTLSSEDDIKSVVEYYRKNLCKAACTNKTSWTNLCKLKRAIETVIGEAAKAAEPAAWQKKLKQYKDQICENINNYSKKNKNTKKNEKKKKVVKPKPVYGCLDDTATNYKEYCYPKDDEGKTISHNADACCRYELSYDLKYDYVFCNDTKNGCLLTTNTTNDGERITRPLSSYILPDPAIAISDTSVKFIENINTELDGVVGNLKSDLEGGGGFFPIGDENTWYSKNISSELIKDLSEALTVAVTNTLEVNQFPYKMVTIYDKTTNKPIGQFRVKLGTSGWENVADRILSLRASESLRTTRIRLGELVGKQSWVTNIKNFNMALTQLGITEYKLTNDNVLVKTSKEEVETVKVKNKKEVKNDSGLQGNLFDHQITEGLQSVLSKKPTGLSTLLK